MSRQRGWINHEVQKLRHLAGEGRSEAEIALTLDRSKQSVRSRAAAYGVSFCQARETWTTRDVETLRDMAAAGRRAIL